MVGEVAARLDLRRHLGELVADRLEAPDRPAERLALLRVVERALEGRLHPADGAERHREPLPLEVGHDQVEALVLLAEQVLRGHAHVGERQLAGVGRVPAELLELARHLEAGHALLEHEEREAVVAALLRRLHGGHVEVRAHAVRDERLGAVHDVLAVLAARERLQARDVGAGARLGDRERADLLALEPGHDPALLLLLGAELEDRRHRDPDVPADPGGHAARPAARHLLGEDRAVHGVAALAAVLLGIAEIPRKPSSPMRVNSSRGNSSASSHSGACGRISRSTNERSDSRSASCSSVKGGIGALMRRTRSSRVGPGAVALAHLVPALERRVAAALVVEPEQVALPVLRVGVVVGAHLGDQPVAHDEPLGAAVDPPLVAVPRVATRASSTRSRPRRPARSRARGASSRRGA